jgi:hypothetical protein
LKSKNQTKPKLKKPEKKTEANRAKTKPNQKNRAKPEKTEPKTEKPSQTSFCLKNRTKTG